MCTHQCVEAIEFFLSRYRLVLADFPRCLTCAKQAVWATSSYLATTQVTAPGNNNPEANVDGGVNAVATGDHDNAADNAVELDEDFSDDEDDDMPNNDVATKSSTSKNRGGKRGRKSKTKRVALTVAHRVAIIKHYEDSGPMRITMLIDWVMEKFGESIKKPPSHATMSILLNKQKTKFCFLHNTAMNERVIKGKWAI